MSNLAVVVLAAGEGTRMRSATPKVLHKIAGLELLGHVLATATSLHNDRVVCVLRHEKERIENYVHAFYPQVLIAEQDEIPGTGRAAEAALDALADFDGDVLVLSGDVPLIDVESLSQLLDEHREAGNAATLVSMHLDNPHGYGRIIRDRGDLIEIVEQKDATATQLEIQEVNAGVYIFDSKKLGASLAELDTNNAQGEKYLTDVIGKFIAAGQKVSARQIGDNWLVAGINDRVQLSEVEKELNQRIVRAWQLAGVTIVEPQSTWIDITVSLAQDVTLLPSVRLHGFTRVETGSVIGPDSTLTDCEVGQNVKLSRSDATASKIGNGAQVGPFAFLRPGTELGEDGKIGTFVETKNAQIAAGAKVPHLSYVGDASIGSGSNIGAGTIFANYDGVKKHRTEIGSQVRTGSGNVFVAPVKIGDGAYTAAGSTIRRDVASGALALNPTPQKNLAGWVLENRPGSASAQAVTDTE